MTVAFADDPDMLDPTLARTLVGRMVFMSLCEKLYDIDQKLNVVPQLAASPPTISCVHCRISGRTRPSPSQRPTTTKQPMRTWPLHGQTSALQTDVPPRLRSLWSAGGGAEGI
jgi:hypothetical protein